MTVPAEIIELWRQHSAAAFPGGYGGRKLNDIDLSVLDAELAATILRYINQGSLEFRQLEALSSRLIDLNNIVLLLDRDELVYFNRLRTLADLILQELKR